MDKFIRFLFYFSISWLIVSLFFNPTEDKQSTEDIVFTGKDGYVIHENISVTITNNTNEEIILDSQCANFPMEIDSYENGKWGSLIVGENCENNFKLAPKSTEEIIISEDVSNYFSKIGRYRFRISLDDRDYVHEFEITNPGTIKSLWLLLVYQPIYNLLIFFVDFLPGHSLAFSIIFVTIIVRLILLAPNQKALKNQAAMQKFQPKLDEIKKKYKGDQQKISEETLKLWREHKINPAGSCLPILLQFPVLIALFFVLQGGLSANNSYLLYDIFKGFDYEMIQTSFLFMDLKNMGPWYLALAVGLLQFFQISISMPAPKNDKKDDLMAMQMQIMNKVMKYVMPLMIAIFTMSVPAGVGLYWGISTLFGIAQHQFIKKQEK